MSGACAAVGLGSKHIEVMKGPGTITMSSSSSAHRKCLYRSCWPLEMNIPEEDRSSGTSYALLAIGSDNFAETTGCTRHSVDNPNGIFPAQRT